MRCSPANQTDITAEKSRLHLICLASLNIFPSRGRLGTPRRRVLYPSRRAPRPQCAQRNSRRGAPIHAGLPAIHAACGNSFVSPVPHHAALRAAYRKRRRRSYIASLDISRRRHIASAGYLACEARIERNISPARLLFHAVLFFFLRRAANLLIFSPQYCIIL